VPVPVNRERLSVLWCYVAFILVGVNAGVSGVLLPPQIRDYGVDKATIGITFFTGSAGFVLAGIVLSAGLLLRARDDASAVRRVSAGSILAIALVYLLFAQTLWPRFDLRPAAQHIAELEAAGIPLAHLDIYQNQFRFLGRLGKPITAFLPHEGDDWAAAHANGRVIRYVPALGADDVRHAELVQPFRSDWLIIERADGWLARRRGEAVAPPATPAQLYPSGYWPYRAFEAESSR
jgi:hypothetical protein